MAAAGAQVARGAFRGGAAGVAWQALRGAGATAARMEARAFASSPASTSGAQGEAAKRGEGGAGEARAAGEASPSRSPPVFMEGAVTGLASQLR